MFVKLALFACLVAAAFAAWNGPLAGGVPASLFPAGISPHACPNYPHCANPSIAANPNAPAPYATPAHYGQYNPAPAPVPAPYHGGYDQNALNSGVYTGDGDYRGEGLAESGAFGDVSQGYNSAPAYNPAPVHHHAAPYHQAAAQLPAGVSAQSCPNYPYCH